MENLHPQQRNGQHYTPAFQALVSFVPFVSHFSEHPIWNSILNIRFLHWATAETATSDAIVIHCMWQKGHFICHILSYIKGAFTYYVTHFLPFLTHVYSQVTHSDIFLYHVYQASSLKFPKFNEFGVFFKKNSKS